MVTRKWIALDRQLITDPKHRQVMGETIWLFMHMEDLADPETGCVYDWRDRDAADDMRMSLSTVRAYRQRLEQNGYISCSQHLHYLNITILNWTPPEGP